MLCACQTDSMLSEQTIQSEKSLQQVLEEQPIDDTHDAFLIDTGGKLGTLLITVEWDPENAQYGYDALLHFAVWDSAHMDTPLQTMESYSDIFHWSQITDANFDGYQDFGYMYSMGNQPVFWHFWIWDESRKLFIRETEFDRISDPTFNQETKTINGWARSRGMGTGLAAIYQWVEGKLICMRRIEIDLDKKTGRIDFIVKDFINDKFEEVYHSTFLPETKEHLDASMKWQDLDYHGEPAELNRTE